jgi:hypothetical protein
VLAQFRDLLGREKARRVTVQQGVEPGGFRLRTQQRTQTFYLDCFRRFDL